MGNSVRHSLGHMCGGEAAKDFQENESDRPVDLPKESKKKRKKNKKKKKVRNGKLGSIKEEGEVQTEPLPNGNGELPPVEGDEKSKEDLNINESQKHEVFLEEKSDKDELHINGESSNLPVITIDCASDTVTTEEEEEKTMDQVSSDIPMSDSYVNNEETTNDESVQGYGEDCDNISLISTAAEEDTQKRSIIMCSFKPIKAETLGIEEADEIFQEAFTNYVPFLEGGDKFKDTILQFQQTVEPEKKSTDFPTLWNVYKMWTEESISKDSVDKIDMSCDLKAMKSAGLALKHIIERVKPILNRCADDAKNIDAIECMQGKMLEGELMTTDKFSAPGKCRRNMNQLKKCTKQITEIELETDEILHCLQVYFDENAHKTLQTIDSVLLARESLIIPEEKNIEQDLEDIFSNLSQESIPILLSECDENSLNDENEDRPMTPLPTVDLLVTPDDHLSHVSSDSHSDHEVDNVFITVYHESDDSCQDSTQVSKEISNSMELDFDIISTNIQAPIDSIEKADDEGVGDLHDLPQVDFDKNHQNQDLIVTVKQLSVNENVCDETIPIEDTYIQLECIPDVPEHPGFESPLDSNVPESDQFTDQDGPYTELKSSNLSNSLSSNSCNSLTVELNCSPDSEVSSTNVDYQSPPLSEDIIGPWEMDDNQMEMDINDQCDVFEQSEEDCNDASEHDVVVITETSSVLGKDNKSNFEEIFNINTEEAETTRSIEIIVQNEPEQSYEQVESNFHTPSLDQNIAKLNSISSSIEHVEAYDIDPSDQQAHSIPLDSNTVSKDVSESIIDSAIELQETRESDKLDSSVDHINIMKYKASTPHSKINATSPACLSDESGIIMSDIASDSDEHMHVNTSELKLSDNNEGIEVEEKLLLSDSCEEIKTENDMMAGQDTTIISFNDKSNISPGKFKISNAKVIFEDINTDNSDFDSNSNTTSIQEIQIFPVNQSCDYTSNTSDENISEEPLLHSSSSASLKERNNANTEEVDVALMVLKEAISNNDVQDEFVDLLCSSISRVLGDEEEKSPAVKLQSIESSHSSYEENSVHKSFQHSKEVLDWVGTHFQRDESCKYDDINRKSDDETEHCFIVPVENGSVCSPHIISHTILKSDKYNPPKGGEVLVKTVNVSLEDITADELIENSTPGEFVQTFVIKSVPETSEVDDTISPLGSPPRRCHSPPLEVDLDPDHNTLDYGNYVFIDPSTGDIQVMRNRSRSLDSLVSMTSSRSSISRFGSFEFVTDFEINIAEKNQEMMKSH